MITSQRPLTDVAEMDAAMVVIVPTDRLRPNDLFVQPIAETVNNRLELTERTVAIQGARPGVALYNGEKRQVWYLEGVEVGGAHRGRKVKFTALERSVWTVTRGL
jgi:hypothetical protein